MQSFNDRGHARRARRARLADSALGLDHPFVAVHCAPDFEPVVAAAP